MAIVKNIPVVITQRFSKKFILPPLNCPMVFTDTRINSETMGLGFYYQNGDMCKRHMVKVMNHNIGINAGNGALISLLYALKATPTNIPLMLYTNSNAASHIILNPVKDNVLINAINYEVNNRKDITWLLNLGGTDGICGMVQASKLASDGINLNINNPHGYGRCGLTYIKLNNESVIKTMFLRVHEKVKSEKVI